MYKSTRRGRVAGFYAPVAVAVVAFIGMAFTSEAQEKSNPLVLLELFTSEGCSSCPPADRMLAAVSKTQPYPGVTVVTLAFHVDYWDHLGWEDPYGDKQYSLRQEAYAKILGNKRIYTPQMIVNGTAAFVGGNRKEARKAIEDTTTRPAYPLEISASKNDDGGLDLQIKTPVKPAPKTILWVAVTEDGLVSEVKTGENKGKTLTHEGVVRYFHRYDISDTENESGVFTATLPVKSAWDKKQCRIVAAVQSEDTGAIRALGQLPLAASE